MTVYFARLVSTGQIKIGFTTRAPKRRVVELCAMYDARFELLATHVGDRSVERELHRCFAAARTGGEFFRPTVELLAYIEKHRVQLPLPPTPTLPWTPDVRARFRTFVGRWHESRLPIRMKARHLRRWVSVADAQEATA